MQDLMYITIYIVYMLFYVYTVYNDTTSMPYIRGAY